MSMAPPRDYAEDAERIERDYVPDEATTQAEVDAALQAAGFPEASQAHIRDWIGTENEAWDLVGEGGGTKVVDSSSVTRAVERETGGAISSGRARQIGESIGSSIDSARAEAAQRVTDDGQVRGENGQFLGKLQNVDEVVRDDGIYFRNTNTGTEARAAGFDR